MTGPAFPKPGPKKPAMRAGQHRRKGIKQRRETPRRGPWRSDEYKAWIRTHRCIGLTERIPHDCDAWKGIQASHTGEDKGAGMKSSDASCLPKCRCLHRQWEKREGVFEGWGWWRRARWAAPLAARFFAEWTAQQQPRSAA